MSLLYSWVYRLDYQPGLVGSFGFGFGWHIHMDRSYGGMDLALGMEMYNCVYIVHKKCSEDIMLHLSVLVVVFVVYV